MKIKNPMELFDFMAPKAGDSATKPKTRTTTNDTNLRAEPIERLRVKRISLGSSDLEAMRSGRRPDKSERSAARAARSAGRTEANVALANIKAPSPVVSAEIITQSVMGS